MPAKNSIKQYLENGFYHIYNRGVEKRRIFLDEQDYAVFLSYLKEYLLPKNLTDLQKILSSSSSSYKEKNKALRLVSLKNFYGEMELLCYSLMPNHFHFLVKQEKADGIDRFISSLGTRYAVYFNRKYRRVGKLFQGVYKAVLVQTDEQLLHLSRYIHLNPILKSKLPWDKVKEPFSLPEYLGVRQTQWVKPEYILAYFSKSDPRGGYVDFIKDSMDSSPLYGLTIDS